jgi:hypothetical protein
MKKTICFFSAIIFALIFITTAYGQMCFGSRSWKLYDDFSSGSIDLTKWAIDQSSATITVENGMLKFVHLAGHANDSSFLAIIQNPHRITGIKATVIFDSCGTPNQDVRARVNSYLGTDQNDPDTVLYSELSFAPYYMGGGNPKIYGTLSLLDSANNFAYFGTPFWGQFYTYDGAFLPADVMGVPYTLIMEWTTKDVSYTLQREVEGLGVINYTWDRSFVLEKFLNAEGVFVGIGTRSNLGHGGCTIYFDNVYIKQSHQR